MNEPTRTESNPIAVMITELGRENAELRKQVVRLREALKDLSLTCTCNRPSILVLTKTGEGGSLAPGPHTKRCIHTRAAAALSESPADAAKALFDPAIELLKLFHDNSDPDTQRIIMAELQRLEGLMK